MGKPIVCGYCGVEPAVAMAAKPVCNTCSYAGKHLKKEESVVEGQISQVLKTSFTCTECHQVVCDCVAKRLFEMKKDLDTDDHDMEMIAGELGLQLHTREDILRAIRKLKEKKPERMTMPCPACASLDCGWDLGEPVTLKCGGCGFRSCPEFATWCVEGKS